MKVLVCGSRSWQRAEPIRQRLVELPRGTELISGGARGADKIAATVGRALGFQVTEYQPNWKPGGVYNPRAGLERNLRMLEERPDLVIAFWDGRSTGTAHMMEAAFKAGVTVEVIT